MKVHAHTHHKKKEKRKEEHVYKKYNINLFSHDTVQI